MEKFFTVLKDRNLSPEMRRMQRWVDKYICNVMKPQAVVGNRMDESGHPVTPAMFDSKDRRAHVCPFVLDSLDGDLFWIEQSDLNGHDEAAIDQLLIQQIKDFIDCPPAHDPLAKGQAATMPIGLKTFLTFFPEIKYRSGSALPIIDDTHKRIKANFRQAGLMLGQFYAGCQQASVYTAKTSKPWTDVLNSPYPAFAIRYMARHDHLFIEPGEPGYDLYKKFFP